MAYDHHSAYEPPTRGYYGQNAPKHSQQAMYSPADPHDQYGQQYDRQFDQRYAQYEAEENRGGAYDYHAGYGPPADRRREQQDHERGGYRQDMMSQQQTMQSNSRYDQPGGQYDGQGPRGGGRERSYDPRFQPRGQQGHPRDPNGYPGPAGDRADPRMQGASSWGPGHGDPRDRPRQMNQPQPQQSSNGRPRPYRQYDSAPGHVERSTPPAVTSPPRGQPEPQNESMAAWKAREKAKMHGMALPETVAQDSAFPTFANGKKKEGAAAERSPEYDSRPTPANDSRHSNDSADSRGPRHALPVLPSSPPSTQSDPNWPMGSGRLASPPRANQATSSTQDHYPEHWPMTNERSAAASDQRRGSQPHNAASGANPQMRRMPPNVDPRRPALASPPSRPVLSPIRTSDLQQRQDYPSQYPPNHADGQSRSATAPPTRGYLPDGARNGAMAANGRAITSPVSAGAAPQTWTSQHLRSERPGDVYDATNSHPQMGITREEQIESEMPNFDSAAPNNLSNPSSRMQQTDFHLNDFDGPGPSSQTAAPKNPQHFAGRGMPPPSQTPQPHNPHTNAARPPMANGYAQSYRGDGDMMNRVSSPQQGPYADQYQGRDDRGYAPDAYGMQPPRAPFTEAMSERRSMDDGRQLAYRPGPQAGRQSATHGPGPVDEHGYPIRPDVNRNYTGQTTRSDPGQQRAISVPPGREGPIRPGLAYAGGPPGHYNPADQVPNQNPDALPHHPVPIRAGLTPNGPGQPAKPVPVRHYNNSPASAASSAQPNRSSADPFAEPVTKAQLDHLRADLDANPYSNKRALIYAKKLVEASTVLASEGGRADPKTTAKNREKYINDAYKRVKKLVSSGYPEAQFYLADCYGQGLLGLNPDPKEAFSLYQTAAKAGHPQAAYRTAVCCEIGPDEGGGTRRDYPKAVQWYRRAATLGDSAAMYKIGVVLLKGLLGEQKNISEAINWLKRAAERADKDTPHALHELAALYESGNTSPEIRNKIVADDSYALELLQRAADLGYKFSQFRLGQAYEYGHLGLEIDNRLSITWYTKAAAQGEHQAELALSGWYLTGADGILEHNDTEAYLWARKAAVSEPPLAKAMFAMGYFTENGIGCPASLEEAKKWYGRAAYYKFPKALERLEELKRGPGKGRSAGKLSRKDQKHDEAECVVM